MFEILNKGKVWFFWKIVEYKFSLLEFFKMVVNWILDDFGSIKIFLIVVCFWKFNKLIWLKDI